MKIAKAFVWCLTFCLIALLAMFEPPANAAGSSSNSNADKKSAVTVDGVIKDGEYPTSTTYNDGAYILCWRVQKDAVYFAMQAKITGWVAVGFNPEKGMLHADIVMGWVGADGKAHAQDDFSTGEMGPHPEDTGQGGKNSILAFGGKEEKGTTTIEFSRKLDTGDTYDQVLDPSAVTKIIWAYGDTDDSSMMHSTRGTATIVLDGPAGDAGKVAAADPVDGSQEPESGAERRTWPVHAGLMILGFVFMVSGVASARLKKKIPTG